MNKLLNVFYQKMKENPNRNIIKKDNIYYTMLDVDRVSNWIANKIYDGNHKFVPFYITKSETVLPIIIGILKSGKIPVPLNTALSLNQAIEQVSDLSYNHIITNYQQYDLTTVVVDGYSMKSKEYVYSMDNYEEETYCVMTSGTTGLPKKIILTDTNILHILREYYRTTQVSAESIVLFLTPPTFDVSLSEILSPILTGAILVCLDDKKTNSQKIKHTVDMIREQKITHVFFSPSYAEVIVRVGDKKDFKNLLCVSIAGEVFPVRLMEIFRDVFDKTTRVFNLYGPAETTLFATYYELNYNEQTEIPIGKPFEGVFLETKKYNNDLELIIGGNGVSKGYTDQGLTNIYFFRKKGLTFYKTGDYVYYNESGELVFKCRKDSQVKINGVRVELNNIDSIISKCPEVKQCKTIYENSVIYTFVVCNTEAHMHKKHIIEYVNEHIPANYGVRLRYIDELPLTVNRKIDVKTLKKLGCQKSIGESLNSVTKKEIKEILSKSFNAIEIRELDSLDLVRFYLIIEEKWFIDIPEDMFLDLKDEEALSAYINEESKNDIQGTIPAINLSTEYELRNLKTIMQRNNELSELFPTLYIQKNYQLKKYYTVLFFDIQIKNNRLDRLQKLVDEIGEKIDITKLKLVEKDGVLYFKYNKDVQVFIYWSLNILNIEDVEKIMFSKLDIPLFFINVSEQDKKIRFYFSHHIIDKYTLNRLGNVVRDYLDGTIDSISKSSYLEFIKFIRKNTLKTNKLIELIPETTTFIIRQSSVKQWISVKNETIIEKDSIELSNLTAYIVARLYFEMTNDSNQLTGSMIANIRDYNDFEADNIIGDLHATFPYKINSDDSLQEFQERVDQMIDIYKKGISIREMIFEGYPHFKQEFGFYKRKWDDLNFAVNFIGESKSKENQIKEIFNSNYNDKYLVSFRQLDELIICLPSGMFEEGKCYIDNEFKVDINIY